MLSRDLNIVKCMHAAGRLLFLSAILCCTLNSNVYGHQNLKVAFLIPETEGTGKFWSSMIPMMRAAADDLNITFNVAYSAASSYKFKKTGVELLTGPNKPDYLITGFWADGTPPLLELAEERHVKTVIINTPIPDDIVKKVGVPRGRYKQWIAHMAPADLPLGYDLADALIEQIRQSGYQGVIKMAGLSGNGDTYTDQQRKEGLKKRLSSTTQVVLTDFLLAEWKRDIAYNMTLRLLNQHPDLKAIWAASDAMALGAIDAIKSTGKQPGKDLFVGGIDWRREALQAVARGEMNVTFGGHFTEGTMALVLIYDYHYGKDFVAELGSQWRTSMQAIKIDNIQRYKKLLNDIDWSSVDFKRYSKVLNPALKHYDFSIERLLVDLDKP